MQSLDRPLRDGFMKSVEAHPTRELELCKPADSLLHDEVPACKVPEAPSSGSAPAPFDASSASELEIAVCSVDSFSELQAGHLLRSIDE